MEKTSSVKQEPSQQIKSPAGEPTPTQKKMWAWVQRAWETCPTNMTLNSWYNKYREQLWEMYVAQESDETSTNLP